MEQGTVPRPTVIPSAPAEKINLVELEKKCNFATAYVYVHQRKDIAKMTQENKDIMLQLLNRYRELGISSQIDYDKFYLYSIIVHSTAIEGSTVTEVEAQMLFDEGITSSKRTVMEQMMNLDLKVAYEYGREWIKRHKPITVDWLITLASKVMARTGNEYSALGGNVAQSESKGSSLTLPSQSNVSEANFSAAKGELRKLNVTAGLGGKSYMSYLKVPERLTAFCEELNRRRRAIDPTDVCAVYDLSFSAHYELVTIHPWADGNGRTSRLLMNLLQWEFAVLPTKVLKEDKATYIQALIDTREAEDIALFQNYMATLHVQHLRTDIDQYISSIAEKMVGKTHFSWETGRYFGVCDRQTRVHHRGYRPSLGIHRHHRQTLPASTHRVWLFGILWRQPQPQL